MSTPTLVKRAHAKYVRKVLEDARFTLEGGTIEFKVKQHDHYICDIHILECLVLDFANSYPKIGIMSQLPDIYLSFDNLSNPHAYEWIIDLINTVVRLNKIIEERI